MAEIKDYSTTAGSNNSASPDGMPEGMAPSGVNNSWREQTARIKRWYDDVSAVNALAGGTTAYTLAASRTISAYAAGDHFVAVCNATNTGAVTLDVDTVGAKSVVTTSQTALGAGQLQIDGIYVFSYDATNDVFICLNPTLEVQDQTAVTSLAGTDVLPVHDGGHKKITVADARAGLSLASAESAGVSLSTPQSVTQGTPTKVVFDTADWDPGSDYNVSTGYFTVPTTGRYQVTSHVNWATNAVTHPSIVSMYLENDTGGGDTIIKTLFNFRTGASGTANDPGGSAEASVTAGDKLSIYVFATLFNTGTGSIASGAGTYASFTRIA